MNIDNTTYTHSPAEVFRHRDRRRYMSPTRSKPRSPRCQYIFRGCANMFPASPASVVSTPILIPSPSTSAAPTILDTEPIFHMSPVHMHYLPPLKVKEPINVMTLRNSGGYRHEYTNSSKPKPRGQSTAHAHAALLYTFPRPTPNPKPSSNSSLKDLPMKPPFGPVSQIQSSTVKKLPECPGREQREDAHDPPSSLFLDVSLSPPPPTITQKHIQIIQNPVVRQGQTSPGPKKRLRVPTPAPTPKLVCSPDFPSTSLPTPTPLRRIPSLPIPIPSHKPREEDTGVFENVSLSLGGDVEDEHDVDDEHGVEDEHNVEDEHPCSQSNHLQLTFPHDPPNELTSNLQLLNGTSSGYRSCSSSLSPKLGLELERDGFIPLSLAASKKVRNWNREVEYFDNPADISTISSDSEPAFPAFSPISCGVVPTDGLTDEEPTLKKPSLRVTTQFNTLDSISSSDSKYTFPHSETKKYYRNGKANLNVFNPPALPSFGGSDSEEEEEEEESNSNSSSTSSDSGSQPFLSFPIPIFLPGDPYAVTQVNVARVPVPSSPMEGQEEEEEGSFKSSVYGGWVEPPEPKSESPSRRDTPTSTPTPIKAANTQALDRPSTPVLWRGQGRKKEFQGDGAGPGAYGLLKKIIGRHA